MKLCNYHFCTALECPKYKGYSIIFLNVYHLRGPSQVMSQVILIPLLDILNYTTVMDKKYMSLGVMVLNSS